MNPGKIYTLFVTRIDNTAFGQPLEFSTDKFPTIQSVIDLVQRSLPRECRIKKHLFKRNQVMLFTDEEYLSNEESVLYVILDSTPEENQEAQEVRRHLTERFEREAKERDEREQKLRAEFEEFKAQIEAQERERTEAFKRQEQERIEAFKRQIEGMKADFDERQKKKDEEYASSLGISVEELRSHGSSSGKLNLKELLLSIKEKVFNFHFISFFFYLSRKDPIRFRKIKRILKKKKRSELKLEIIWE